MDIITSTQFNELVASLAVKYDKTEDEIRDLLTPEGLKKMGYRKETLVEQVAREGVHSREKMAVENLQTKGLI